MKKSDRTASKPRGRTTTDAVRSTPQTVLVVLAALLLGLSLTICIADVFIPLFWARRPAVRISWLLSVTVLLTAVLVPTLHKFARRARSATGLAERAAWISIAAAAAAAAGLVISSAWTHQAILPDLETATGLHPPIYPSPNYAVEFAFAFVLATLVCMVHSDLLSRRMGTERRLHFALGFLALCFLGIYIANNLLPAIDTRQQGWRLDFNFPHDYGNLALGIDFRTGLYQPALRLLAAEAIYPEATYPPLVTLLGLPYLLLTEDAAYVLHVVVLVLANAFCLALVALLAYEGSVAETKGQVNHSKLVHAVVPLLLGFSLFSGYPFIFSVDRGNIDILAMLLGWSAIWVLWKSPDRVWLPVILLSLAVHIKFYPIFLFAVLLYVRGRRILLPAILINTALLFILGPVHAAGFLMGLPLSYQPIVTTANHSAYAFASLLTRDLFVPAPALPGLAILFTFLPLLIWAAGWPIIFRLRSRKQAILAGMMLTTPAMVVVLSMGYDYQLVILWSAMLVLLSRILMKMAAEQDVSDYLQLVLVCVLILVLGRSDDLMGLAPASIRDKYLWIILLQLLMLGNVYLQFHTEKSTPAARTRRRAGGEASRLA